MLIAAHNHMAVATRLALLYLLSFAPFWIQLRVLDFGCEGFKVRVDNTWGWELFVMVLKDRFGFTLFWYLHSYCCLTNPTARWLVALQLVLPTVAM